MAKNPEKNNKKTSRPVISAGLWWTVLICAIAALVVAVFLISRWLINAYFVAEAKHGRYHGELEEMLTPINIPDGYIIWYNIGNYHYQNGDFEEAEADYYRAIESGIPYEKECEIKVNLALAMIEQISDEEWEAFLDCDSSAEMDAQARAVEKTLITARTILCEDGCAHEDDEDGHYEPAQTLKDEIDELLNKDDENEEEDEDEEDEEDQEPDDQDEEDQDQDDDDNSDSREDQVMQHIQDQKEDAQEDRAEQQQYYENYYGYGSEEDEEEGGGGGSGDNGEIW